jgi:hypothetical protein
LSSDISFEEQKVPKFPKESKSSQFKVTHSVVVGDSTTDSIKYLNKSLDYKSKVKKLIKLEESIDDTGYQTLELEEDIFLVMINIIREQIDREDHPLNQFLT